MALPVIADTFRVVLKWHAAAGSNPINVMHCFAPALVSIDVANTFEATATVAMWDWAAEGTFIEAIEVTKLDGVSATQSLDTSTSTNLVGGGTGSPIPQVAGIVKMETALRGRSFRGRIYIPFVGEGETENGNLIDVAAVDAAWSDFRQNMGDASCPLVVASYKLEEQNEIINTLAESRTATQRRRQHR